jgi:HSP20 family molecular chaperone IbpA
MELPELPTMRVAVDVEENDKAYVIKAEAQDGVLTVTIPKVPEVKPQAKEIHIQ